MARISSITFRRLVAMTGLFAMLAAPAAYAQVGTLTPYAAAQLALWHIYGERPDLQAAFGKDGVATPAMKARGLASLEEWAKRYGVNEYPALLFAFGNEFRIEPARNTVKVETVPRALKVRTSMLVPVKATKTVFEGKGFTASSIMVIDDATREVLISRNADKPWPIASITKLMTSLVSLDNGLNMGGRGTIQAQDEVGGARINVKPGSPISVRDMFDSMLIGSANNSANAVARTTGLPRKTFVAAMNARAKEMGLPHTQFVDPTGIEVENVSTAAGVAALAFEAFDVYDIKRATTTPEFTMLINDQQHTIKSTDWLLRDPNNGLFVMGGKTGYLNESRWNFVVKLKDYRAKPLMVVILGSSDRQQSMNEATAAANWVWANYRWQAK